jgi:hypothetical protein
LKNAESIRDSKTALGDGCSDLLETLHHELISDAAGGANAQADICADALPARIVQPDVRCYFIDGIPKSLQIFLTK